MCRFISYDTLLYKMHKELDSIKGLLHEEKKNSRAYAVKHLLDFAEYIKILSNVRYSKYYYDIEWAKEWFNSRKLKVRYECACIYMLDFLRSNTYCHRYLKYAILMSMFDIDTLELSNEVVDMLDDIYKWLVKEYNQELIDWHTKEEIQSATLKVLG